jgi:hypothetical protein
MYMRQALKRLEHAMWPHTVERFTLPRAYHALDRGGDQAGFAKRAVFGCDHTWYT